MTWTTARTARKYYRCSYYGYGCRGIKPGDRYLEHRHPPGGDLGYSGWVMSRECADCACRNGRAEELAA